MTKKTKRTSRSINPTKAVRRNTAPKRADLQAPMTFLFRRYESPVAFTLLVSCAAFAIFIATVTILRRVDDVLMYQNQLIAAMHNSDMGQVAGVSTEVEK